MLFDDDEEPLDITNEVEDDRDIEDSDCWDEDDFDEDSRDDWEDLIDGVGFADPGGNSALRAETPDNPRIHPCPTCGAPNRLTPIDVARGYQCDRCADRAERGLDY